MFAVKSSHLGEDVGLFTFFLKPPTGRPGISDVLSQSGISGLSFDSPFLSPLLFFCLVLLFFPFCHFSANGPFAGPFPPENSKTFSVKS